MNAQSIAPACYEKPDFEPKNENTLCEDYGDKSPDVTIGTNSSSTTNASSLGYTSVNGQKVVINGKLFLNVSMSFQNAILEFGPGAEIIVEPTKLMYARRTVFYACTDMWRGITVKGHGRLNMFVCEVEDAQYAISAEKKSFLSLISNRFNRNYVGIRNITTGTGTASLNFNYFIDNTFICSDPLNDGYSGQTPTPGDVSFAGILLENCVASIGKDNVLRSLFTRMQYGIHATNSTVMVQKCTFSHMVGDAADAASATGIYQDGGSLTVKGSGGSIFEDCGFNGIVTIGANLDVANNAFSGTQEYGIQSFHNLNAEQITIASNAFDLSEDVNVAGILLERSAAFGNTAHNVIDRNYIEISGSADGKYGINVAGVVGAEDQMQITNNRIEVTSTANNIHSIYVTAGLGDRFQILNDTIYFNSVNYQAERFGIALYDAFFSYQSHLISENVAIGSGSHNPGQCAIHVDNARNVTICSNIMDQTHRGIHLLGSLDPCRVQNNDINAHAYGLYITESEAGGVPAIGLQERYGNTWSTTPADYTEWAAACQYSEDLMEFVADPGLSEFIVQSASAGILPDPINPNEDWFSVAGGDMNPCASADTTIETLTELQEETVTNNIAGYVKTSRDEWEMEYAMMLTLRDNSALLSNFSALGFYNANSTVTTAGALSYSLHELRQIMIPGSGEQTDIDDIREGIAFFADSLMSMENSYATAPDTTTGAIDTTFLNAKRVVADSLLNLMGDQAYWVNNIEITRIADLGDLKDFNDTITMTYIYEQNYKALNNYLIKSALGTATTGDYEDMVDIATLQSPDTSGSAVRLIRKLLPPCEWLNYMSGEEEEEEESLEGFRPGVVGAALDAFGAYPNPADGNLFIRLPKNASGKLLVRNTDGKTFYSQEIGEQSEQRLLIDSQNWPAGIYFCTLQGQGITPDHKLTLVIAH